MKYMFFPFLMLFLNTNALSDEVIRQERMIENFKSITYTRGWVFGMLRVKNSDQSLDEEMKFSWSMTAYAFNYWLLSRNGHVEIDEVFDNLIIRTFKDKELPLDSLNDPLMRNNEHGGVFAPYIVDLSDDNYNILVQRFKNFVLVTEED